MRIKEISVVKLKNYKLNSKIHTDKQIRQLANIIKKYGFTQPLVIDKDYVVIIGHGRLFAAKRLGYDKVPCVVRDDLSDDEVKALRVLDNKTSSQTGYDDAKLSEDLDGMEFDFTELDVGFDDLYGEIDVGEVDLPDNESQFSSDPLENNKNNIIKNTINDNINEGAEDDVYDQSDHNVEHDKKEKVYIVEAHCETFDEQLSTVNLLRGNGIKTIIR